MATAGAPIKPEQTNKATKAKQIRVARRSPAYWRVMIDNPPINVMGPEMVEQFQEVIECSRGRRGCQGGCLRQCGRRLLPESLRFHG